LDSHIYFSVPNINSNNISFPLIAPAFTWCFFESKRGRLNHHEKESAVKIPNVFHSKKQSKIPPHF